ncbi:MAG: hypothetical protein ACPG4N_08895, partial [Gammaproteobacteria bacterium]
EGRRICVQLVQQLAEIPGVAGVHIMAYRQEESVKEIVQASGVLGDRVPWYPGRDAIPESIPESIPQSITETSAESAA